MKNLLKILFLSLISVIPAFSDEGQGEDDNTRNEIVINSHVQVNVKEVFPGSNLNSFMEEQIIKFEIILDDDTDIKIIKSIDLNTDDFDFDAEWKAGPVTGFEEEFVNGGVYRPLNNKFYVTIKINSIKVSPLAEKGIHIFNPAITVEYFSI